MNYLIELGFPILTVGILLYIAYKVYIIEKNLSTFAWKTEVTYLPQKAVVTGLRTKKLEKK